MEIKKVLINKYDGTKFVVIPRNCDINAGEYVKIIKIEIEDNEENEN